MKTDDINRMIDKIKTRMHDERINSSANYNFSRSWWYGAEYHWIHYDEVAEWCTEHFGPHPKRPDAWSRWVHKHQGRILFRDEGDYLLFILRWQ